MVPKILFGEILFLFQRIYDYQCEVNGTVSQI